MSKRPLIYHNEPVELDLGRYVEDSAMSVRLLNERGQTVAKVTACLAPHYTPPDGCIVVRNYSENAGMLIWLYDTGIVADALPVDTIMSGLVDFPVVRLSHETLADYFEQEATARFQRDITPPLYR